MTNHRFEVKKAGADITLILTLFVFIYQYFTGLFFPSRTTLIPSTLNNVNVNSLLPLWLDNASSHVPVDFRVITLILAIVLFTSIYASIMLRQYIGGVTE